MKKDKVFIEGYVVGSFADTLGTQGKQIHIASGDIVDIDESFIYKSIGPEKVTIPQFVADWIEHCRGLGYSLYQSMELVHENAEIKKWFIFVDNQDLFARAWLDGYEVEKEKKYKVVLLNYNDGHLNLVNVRTLGENIIFFTKKTQFDPRSLKLTKAEIISSGFGWVFDCPGVEVTEVE